MQKGVLNIVTGPGRVVGDALVNHPDADKLTFTGSPGVGRGIMKGAADVRLPWGREHGTAALDNFTEPKAVWMNLNV